MSPRDEVLARFARAASGGDALWLPDLRLWHQWHRERGTLPAEWREAPLAAVAADLGAPAWLTARPWRVETPGIELQTVESADERVVTYATPAGTLTARWSLMPDGEWWQTEYPVKSADDLAAVREYARALRYVPDSAEWARLDAEVGPAGVVALELPRRPYSEVLHVFLGWSEGLMLLLGEGADAVAEVLGILEAKVQGCVRDVAALPGRVAFSPDNLDGQFITPPAFRQHLAESYRASAVTLHAAGQQLVVHAGGPVRRLLPLLAAVGVDAVAGVAGPPQGDADLAQARAAAGPDLVLWGGIPQDYLLPTHPAGDLAAATQAALEQARADPRAILGVADQVPVGAEPARLRTVAELVRAARQAPGP